MERLTIDAKPKRPFNFCGSCWNGKDFVQEQYFKTDSMGNDFKTHICGKCNTKYHQPYVELDIEIENYKAEEISFSGFRHWVQSDGSSLTKTNASYHAIRIGLQIKEERKVLADQTERYAKTGECDSHYYVTSHPFTTAEGKFELECCPICKQAKIDYKGITYKDDVMNIVRFIAHQGIEFQKAQEVVAVPDFDISEIIASQEATKELPDFTLEEEQPDFTITPMEIEQFVL